MPAHGAKNGRVRWTNRAGEEAIQSASFAWADKDCRFQVKPRADFSISGGTTFSEYWGEFEVSAVFTNKKDCECVIITVRFKGRYKIIPFILSWNLGPIEKSYQICADGSGTATPLT